MILLYVILGALCIIVILICAIKLDNASSRLDFKIEDKLDYIVRMSQENARFSQETIALLAKKEISLEEADKRNEIARQTNTRLQKELDKLQRRR